MSITFCTLAHHVSDEMRLSVATFKKFGVQQVIGVTSQDSALAEFVKSENLDHINIAWNDNFSEAFNTLFSVVLSGYIFRLDYDEWITDAELERLLSLVADLEHPMIGTVISRNLLNLGDFLNYVETRVLRIWPADAEIRYVNVIHERPTVDMIVRCTGQRNPTPVSIYIWHTGYVLERRVNKAIREIGILTKILEDDPDNFFYSVNLASAMNAVDRGKASELFAQLSVRLVMMATASRVPNEAEIVIVEWLASARGNDLYGNTRRILEQIALRQFDRSFTVLWALVGVHYRLADWETALYYAIRARDLRRAGNLSMGYAPSLEAQNQVDHVIANLSSRVPAYVYKMGVEAGKILP